jgi:hypothetical protein
MEPTNNSSSRHPATYCWPAVLALGSLISGHLLAASRPEVFIQTHFFFEIAMTIGFFAAILFSFRLWNYRSDQGLRFPLYLNIVFVTLVGVGLLISFIEMKAH